MLGLLVSLGMPSCDRGGLTTKGIKAQLQVRWIMLSSSAVRLFSNYLDQGRQQEPQSSDDYCAKVDGENSYGYYRDGAAASGEGAEDEDR